MIFEEFKKRIAKIAKIELPGKTAHYKMAPLERYQYLLSLHLYDTKVKKAGIMVLFYPSEKGETHFVLIQRKTYKGVHSNQIGFPGGKWEPTDTSMQDTALRETEEEIGVNAANIKVIKALSKVYIPPSNFNVFPFIGLLHYNPKFSRQVEEVEAVLEISLQDFMDDKIIGTKNVTTSYATNLDVPAYLIQGFTVWGATAMMLSEVRELLKQVL